MNPRSGRTRLLLLTVVLVLVVLTAGCAEVQQAVSETVEDVTGPAEAGTDGVDVPGDSADLYDRPGPSIDEKLGQSVEVYYRKIASENLTCQSGDCPDSFLASEHFVQQDCVFCAGNGSAVHDEEETLVARTSAGGSMISAGGCTERDSFGYPSELEILRLEDDLLVARGTGQGVYEKTGDGCSTPYRLHYRTEEMWVFSVRDLTVPAASVSLPDGETVVNATERQEAPKSYTGPDEDGEYRSETLSTRLATPPAITVTCTFPTASEALDGVVDQPSFRVGPRLALVAIDGIDVAGQSWSVSPWLGAPRPDPSYGRSARFSVAAYHDGEYAVAGACDGPNGRVLGEDTVTVSVRGSPNGHFPTSTLEG